MTLLERINSSVGEDSEILNNIMTYILACGRHAEINELDDFISQIDPSKIELLYSVGILRGSFSLHDKLPSWNKLRDMTAAVAMSREEGDGADIMHGLLDTSWYKRDSMSRSFDALMGVHPSLRNR